MPASPMEFDPHSLCYSLYGDKPQKRPAHRREKSPLQRACRSLGDEETRTPDPLHAKNIMLSVDKR
jgi:hypothetical protein